MDRGPDDLVEDMRAQALLRIDLVREQAVQVSDNSAALHIYRIAQEALNNAIKHADAGEIEVRLGLDGARGFLSVRDDGLGFRPDPRGAEGLGLRIMKHRCGLIDGELRIVDGEGEHRAELVFGRSYSRQAGVEHDVINAGPRELTFIEVEIKAHGLS